MKWWGYLIAAFIKTVFAAALAFLLVAVDSGVVWSASYILGAVYIALLGDVGADITGSVVSAARKKPTASAVHAAAGFVFTLPLLIYGTVNMQVISPKEHIYTSEKLHNTYKIVFLTDLHYGSPQHPEVVEKAFEDIRDLSPDILLLGGDITDEYTTKDEMLHIYELIGSIGVPTFCVYGNHDRQPNADLANGKLYSEDELASAIVNNGITILRDELFIYSDDLVILGRKDVSDVSRVPVSELPYVDKNAYFICLDHSPYQDEDISATGADLQLSGHAHAGQLFPLQWLYGFGKKHIYGEYREGNTVLYVSSGISGWAVPLRTEEHCNYEVITLCRDGGTR